MSIAAVYQNFSFDNKTITLTVIIWALVAGLFIAGAATVYNKYYLGALVRALVRAGAASPDSAKTLAELGLKPSAAYKRALKAGKMMRKYVSVANADKCVGVKKHTGFFGAARRFVTGSAESETLELSEARLYVPEEVRIRAELIYEKKGSQPWLIAVMAAAIIILGVALQLCMPKLLELTDSMITMYKNL